MTIQFETINCLINVFFISSNVVSIQNFLLDFSYFYWNKICNIDYLFMLHCLNILSKLNKQHVYIYIYIYLVMCIKQFSKQNNILSNDIIINVLCQRFHFSVQYRDASLTQDKAKKSTRNCTVQFIAFTTGIKTRMSCKVL